MKPMALLAIVCSALMACSTGHPSRGNAEPSAVAKSCQAADRFAGLSASKGDHAGAVASVVWVAEAGSPRLNQNWVVAGPCAALISGLELNAFALETGEVFSIEDGARLRQRSDISFPSDVVDPSAAALHPGEFLGAARVNPSRDGETSGDFVGLWHDGGVWVVASFSWKDRGPIGAVKPLMRSKLPLRGLNYFPAPDTPGGTITFVQTVGERTVALVGFDWQHPDWFRAP
jgi:hypothetical protein